MPSPRGSPVVGATKTKCLTLSKARSRRERSLSLTHRTRYASRLNSTVSVASNTMAAGPCATTAVNRCMSRARKTCNEPSWICRRASVARRSALPDGFVQESPASGSRTTIGTNAIRCAAMKTGATSFVFRTPGRNKYASCRVSVSCGSQNSCLIIG